MDLNIEWTQGRCNGRAYFISDEDVCFQSGSFIKVCSTNTFYETSLQGPPEDIECICADPVLNVIAVASQNIHVLRYPDLKSVSQWMMEKNSRFIQVCFVGDEKFLTLEGSPSFNLTLWNWKTAVQLGNIQHPYPADDVSSCTISVHPVFTEMAVFQHFNSLHFYDIRTFGDTEVFSRRTVYLPTSGDTTGASILCEQSIKKLTYFDKMQHDSWGIHSELLHSLPMKIMCADLTERELVKFYDDFVMKQERLEASCHCWLPDKSLIVACVGGTVLSVALDFSVKVLHCLEKSESKSSSSNYITNMAFNKNGLYAADKNGDIVLIQNVDEWEQTVILPMEDRLMQMTFSPDFKHLLIVNISGAVSLLSVFGDDKKDIVYLSTCQDDSSIVGIFVPNENICITAKHRGLVEVWDINVGIPLSQFHVGESIKCMEGCPSSSTLMVSGSSACVFFMDFSSINDIRIIHISKPSENAICMIKCENFGRYSFFVSDDKYIFIYNILPSAGFTVLGYIKVKYEFLDLAAFSKSSDGPTEVLALVKSQTDSYIIAMTLPTDFIINCNSYWEDATKKIQSSAISLVTIYLGLKCCSIVAHHLKGFMLYFPAIKQFISVPFEKIGTFSLTPEDETLDPETNFEDCKMFLSNAHCMLLVIRDSGVCIRKSDNLDAIYERKFNNYFHTSPCCAFAKNLVLIEGSTGVLTCLRLSKMYDMEEMDWTSYCRNKANEENKVLSEMETMTKTEQTAWITQMVNKRNESVISELKVKKEEFENKLKNIQRELNNLADENFSIPAVYQLENEKFVLDENMKKKMAECRSYEAESLEKSLKERLEKLENDTQRIKKKCVNNMLQRGKVLKPLRKGALIYNYSIPILSAEETRDISYSFKKRQLEKCLAEIKEKGDVYNEANERKLSFEEYIENEIHEIGGEIKPPFLLQNREDRIDYILTLKYIILKKRMAFNRRFDEIENFRANTVQNVRENNSRIRQIIKLTKDDSEEVTWQPDDFDNDDIFEVTEKEVEDACRVREEEDSDQELAGDFLRDEWLLKLKPVSIQTKSLVQFRVRLEEDDVDTLKQEMDEKLRAVDALVREYERVHNGLVEEKLHMDLEINQNELQLCLVLFSVANFSVYKKWEIYTRKLIEELRKDVEMCKTRIHDLEAIFSKHKNDIDKLQNDAESCDDKVNYINKTSRDKQDLLEAYKARPVIPIDSESLNPYKEAKTAATGNIFEELNSGQNKPQNVPSALWKQLCSLREEKYSIEKDIEEGTRKLTNIGDYIQEIRDRGKTLKQDIVKNTEDLQILNGTRMRCNFETPAVLPISYAQLEYEYPEDLAFKKTLFLKRHSIEILNAIIENAGSEKLDVVRQIAKTNYEKERNESKIRTAQLTIRDLTKEIELVKSIQVTKDLLSIVQDETGFSLQDRVDAFDSSQQLQMQKIVKQINTITGRISDTERKKDAWKRSIHEKNKEIKKLKGDIAELQKVEKLAQ